MAFKGITFAGQNVTPKNDGGLYQAHYGDGILDGCSMAISGDDLVIQSGHFIMGGRVVHVDGATNVDLSGRGLTTGYIQVIMNADMSKGEGLQVYSSFVEQATTTFPALTTDDINDTGTLYQIQLAVVQISGGNLTAITTSLGYSTLKVESSTAKGIIRPSNASGSIVISAENGNFVFRPKGDADPTQQKFIGNSGQITTQNDITINPASGDAYIYLQENGTNAGQIRHDTTNGRIVLNNSNGGQISLYDSGTVYVSGNGNGNIEMRPNSSAVGRVVFGTDGQQIGGHPLTTDGVSSGAGISITAGASTYKSIKGYTGLDSSGVYLFTGKVTFSPNDNTESELKLCLSDTANANHLALCQSRVSRTNGVKSLNISMLLTGYSSMYLTFGSTNIGGTIGSWTFAYVRIA